MCSTSHSGENLVDGLPPASIEEFCASDLVVLRDNIFGVHIEVSFVLSFSSGETPSLQINHAANFSKIVIFSYFFFKKKTRETNQNNYKKS